MVLPLDEKPIIEMVKPLAATPFNYDPMPVLRASTTPQLWILGGDDLDAPSAETSRRIKSLIAEGKNFILTVYPGAEHGMTLYELDAKGKRLSTRYAPGYFQLIADLIKRGRIRSHSGGAEIRRQIKRLSARHPHRSPRISTRNWDSVESSGKQCQRD